MLDGDGSRNRRGVSRTTSPSWKIRDPGRVGRDRHRVAGQQVLVLAQADDQRAAEPRADDLAGPLRADDREPVCSLEPRQGALHGLEQVVRRSSSRAIRWAMTSVSVWLANTNPCASSSRRRATSGSRSRRCGRRRRWPPRPAAQVGMGIAVGGRPVRGPARVADPASARGRLASSNSSRTRTRPARLRTISRSPSIVASPALS